jgi:hypothetical protein
MTVDLQTETRSALVSQERGPAGSPELAGPARRRMMVAGPLVGLVTVLAALLATDAAGVPLRDPDHVAGRRLLLVVLLVVALTGLDIAIRAGRRSGGRWPSRAALRGVRRERWTLGRAVAVGSALVGFYATYLAYRNLKSVVPLLRPGELFDRQLATFDRGLFGGNDPAEVLHALWGTGVSTHVLSAVYMLFFFFIPASLAVALVFSPDLRAGLFYVTAQSINWVLGAASYFLLPSLGPVYVEPSAFADLPASEVSRLQDVLLEQRLEFLGDTATGTAQSIGAFASLHVSIFFTAALAAHLLGLGPRVKIGAWILFALTAAATIHFGWHYVADDLGGMAIGVLSLAAARVLTGFDLRAARRRSTPTPTPP